MIITPDGAKIEMQWKNVKYINHEDYILFQIIPMFEEKDIILVPNKENWNKIASIFSFEERNEIIFLLENIPWKRDIRIIELDVDCYVNCNMDIRVGMLEHTEGYIKMSNDYLFDPESRIEKSQVKQLYYRLEQRFAEGLSGKVEIPKSTIISESVMERIVLPALEKNSKIKIEYLEQ